MPVITYVAQRSIKAGHSASTQYQLELELQAFPQTTRAKKFTADSLDDTRASYLYKLAKEYNVITDFLSYASLLADYVEFIDSVANGETFQIDFTGTIASPGTDVDMVLLSDSWTFTRQGNLYFTLAFHCREA